jgi:hypothetical protein
MCPQLTNMRRQFVILVAAVSSAGPILGQSPNQLWFTSYNGEPTPGSDVAVQTVGSAGGLTVGSLATFISQTNFTAFNSPFAVVMDPAMGKAYVLDNNVQDSALASTPEYIYSFNLAGTPAQIVASAHVIYTLPVPAGDASSGLYPLMTGLALDPARHFLYFNQSDATTPTNSYIGRLDLATSSASDLYGTGGGSPVLHLFDVGLVPGQGALALDQTNLYLGAISRTGNSGVFAVPRDVNAAFSELVTLTTNDMTFTNGFVSGVASDPADHLIYYLTFNAGYLNGNFDTNQNAVWVYNTVTKGSSKIASGYSGYPDSLAVDPVNGRYYFTVGRSGATSINAQAIYGGVLASTAAPTLLYTPALSGLDASGQINAGQVILQGLFVEDAPVLASVSPAIYPASGAPVVLAPGLVLSDASSTLLMGATVAIAGGTFVSDGDILTAVTSGTQITASYNPTNEVLTLAGADTVTNYQEVLSTVAFGSTNADPTNAGTNSQRSVAWTVTDGVLAGFVTTNTVMTLRVAAPPTNRLAASVVPGGRQILFTGSSGKSYTVQFAVSPAGPWTNLSSVLVANSLGLILYTDANLPSVKTRFYRIKAD